MPIWLAGYGWERLNVADHHVWKDLPILAHNGGGTRGAEVMVAGKRCPVTGRISMDLMAVDVTDLERNAVRRGHLGTLIGEGTTVDELAHRFGTIGHEVLTSLGTRYARGYKGEAVGG